MLAMHIIHHNISNTAYLNVHRHFRKCQKHIRFKKLGEPITLSIFEFHSSAIVILNDH